MKQQDINLMPGFFTFEAPQAPKPFIKWVGGKGQLLSSIERALPTTIYSKRDITYVEPFVGGGAVLFWILNKLPNIRKAYINDINSDLTTAYQIIRDNVNSLIDALADIQDGYYKLNSEDDRKEFYLARRSLYNTKQMDSITRTAIFIFLNKTCFNGLHRVNKQGQFNVPFGRYNKPTICDKQTLRADSELLKKVEITTGDFESTLQFADQNSFFYLDPPYKPLSQTSSFNSYVKEEFDDAEQIRLRHFCDTVHNKGGMWLLSNSDVKSNDPTNDFFDDMYSAYNIERVLASRSVNANPAKRGKLTELLISNSNHEKTVQHTQLVG